MSEVKRYQAVHIRYEESNIRYGEGCEVDMVTASDFDKQAQEIERLRSIISDCAKSCGATVSVECSLDFMAHLPVEIAVVISTLREERDSQQRTCIAAMTELSQLKSRQSGVVDAQSLLDWNREQPEPRPIMVGREYQVSEACNSLNPAEQLNKAQGEMVHVVAWLSETFANGRTCQRAGLSRTQLQGLRHGTEDKDARIISDQPLMTVAQHERIVAALTSPADHSMVPSELLKEAYKHLDNWLELNCCECEEGHSCGRNEVARTQEKIRAILSSKGDV